MKGKCSIWHNWFSLHLFVHKMRVTIFVELLLLASILSCVYVQCTTRFAVVSGSQNLLI
jgi:hypothetical protein